VRAEAADALGHIGAPAHGTLKQLIAGLDDQAPLVRQACAFALGNLGDPRAIAALEVVAAHDPDPDATREARESMAQIGAT
jgi:HEAT repeat protein